MRVCGLVPKRYKRTRKQYKESSVETTVDRTGFLCTKLLAAVLLVKVLGGLTCEPPKDEPVSALGSATAARVLAAPAVCELVYQSASLPCTGTVVLSSSQSCDAYSAMRRKLS